MYYSKYIQNIYSMKNSVVAVHSQHSHIATAVAV